MNPVHPRYKWYMLALAVLTMMLIMAIPSMAMSVMAKEISQDLGLSLTQVGVVWGIGMLPGIVTGLFAGAIGDRLGPKRILVLGCLVVGLLGAARGLAFNFPSLVAIILLLGALSPFTGMSAIKICGLWFPSRQLGLANGVVSMGMATGFLIGSLTSATLVSPLLGGWRYVFLLYGGLAALMCIPWFFTPAHPPQRPQPSAVQHASMRQTLAHVVRLKNVWLLGLTVFGVGGCVQSMLGYLPLYLRTIGWQPLRADGALSAFHTISLVCTMPIALLSDRMGSRKRLLFAAAVMIMLGVGLLSIADGALVWVCVLMAGFVRDGFMAIYTTMVIETEGVGPQYAGTALGVTMGISGLGSVFAPPLGNSLAAYHPAAPFALWAAWALFGIVCLSLTSSKLKEIYERRKIY